MFHGAFVLPAVRVGFTVSLFSLLWSCHFQSFSFSFSFLLAVLGFELRASRMLGNRSSTWATSQPYFESFSISLGPHKAFLGWEPSRTIRLYGMHMPCFTKSCQTVSKNSQEWSMIPQERYHRHHDPRTCLQILLLPFFAVWRCQTCSTTLSLSFLIFSFFLMKMIIEHTF